MPLTLIDTKAPSNSDPQNEKVDAIRGEIVSLLEEKIEDLRRESRKIQGVMEQAQFRIGNQGFEVTLDDLRSGRWSSIATEVKLLQEVVAIFDAHRV